MALGGVGLTITNTKAVMEALFGVKTAFARTPKYRVKKKGEAVQAKVYRKRLGIMPWIELSIGTLLCLDGLVRHLDGELLHRAVPAAVRLRLLVYRTAEPAAGPLRARRQGRGAPRRTRSPIRSGYELVRQWTSSTKPGLLGRALLIAVLSN